uniref:DNA polymerase eta n=1 Tax=Lygus hesperus TaxID=30085 RepID=A0A0A9XPW2_LYGHE
MTDRIVALVDMDCFYCQVEERLNPKLKGKPTVVVQYNPWKGGGIIAVNYEARAQGVKRGMRGEKAKQLCPDLVLCSVPMIREKADLARYRDAGREVIDVMCKFSECVQRASIDEAYLDLTSVVDNRLNEFQNGVPPDKIPNTFVVGYTSESSNDEALRSEGTGSWLKDLYFSGLDDVDAKKLAVGAVVVEEMRREVLKVTGFKCSAGIAHNKILAKLAAGIHKPNRQTVLPQASVAQLYSTLPVYKIRSLGGKLGRELEDIHGVKMMADLMKFSQSELTKMCDERMGTWLYQIARGYDNEPVQARLISKSIACCKNFPGRMSLSKGKEVEHWLNKLTEELLERLLEDETMNQRKAKHMVFSIRLQEGGRGKEVGSSKSVPLLGYNHEKIVNSARMCLKKFCTQEPSTSVWSPTITFLGLSAGKFVDTSNKLMQLFGAMKKNRPSSEAANQNTEPGDTSVNESQGPKSKYFENVAGVDEGHSPVDRIAASKVGAETNLRRNATATLKDETMNHSSLDESTGPSFFEKMLLNSVPSNGKRIKLNIIPDLPQLSPRKSFEGADVEIGDHHQPVLNEPKGRTNKISDFFAKSPPANIVGQNIENSKIGTPTTRDGINTFFGKRSSNWVDPKEIFPDADGIDDATLALFPPSYQKKILELKNLRVKDIESEKKTEFLGTHSAAGSSKGTGSGSHSKTQVSNLDSKSSCVPTTSAEINGAVPIEGMDSGEGTSVSIASEIRKSVFHDSQQPSTSKSGLDYPPARIDSSPEDMFASNSPRSGPSTECGASKWFSDESNPSPDNGIPGWSLTCPECQVFLAPEEHDEHMDYHYALRLQQEMNQQVPQTVVPRPPPSTSKPFKRKANQKKSKQPEPKKIKSIDLFFKKAS